MLRHKCRLQLNVRRNIRRVIFQETNNLFLLWNIWIKGNYIDDTCECIEIVYIIYVNNYE